MSDVMRPISFGRLMEWVLAEHAKLGSVFGIRKALHHDGGVEPIFGETIEVPFGPAAGPATQLAQNIVASYVAGARFFELKTVQVVDGAELARCVPKPCISATDECYNCEWSTELEVSQAFDEYVKAWWACKLLSRELGVGSSTGFVFNMSVGYDLAGIKTPKVNAFIEDMIDASDTAAWAACRDWTLANLGRFEHVDAQFVRSVSPHISTSVTESTLHGCPPDEIERIATYLISEKGLHTLIKCNPTLLGYEFARQRLDELGFDRVVFDGHHFAEDLQADDAIAMFRRLSVLANERGLSFGVKLTNTLPVDVAAHELPSDEMYMSGRALFPLTIHLARRLSEKFDGTLRISYSAGADAHNVRELYAAGIWPITMATTLLKPGGYERFGQVARLLEGMDRRKTVDARALSALDDSVGKGRLYRSSAKPPRSRKVPAPLPLTSCFIAPCRSGCPIGQDIPGYLHAVDEGDLAGALRIVVARNALPHITGNLCPHPCTARCERGYYEPEAAAIRASKLTAAQGGFATVLKELQAAHTSAAAAHVRRVAVVGGGPAGLATAFFLTRAGTEVTIVERSDALGGVARRIIPEFRIPTADIDADVELCLAFGAQVELNREVESIEELKGEGYDDVVVCVGAWARGRAALEHGEEYDALEFLAAAKAGRDMSALGPDIVVVGAGNTAMDVARVAMRLPTTQNVRILYRRTRRYMPAEEEELNEAVAEGVEFYELLAPKSFDAPTLTCERMVLGAPDVSGRCAPQATGEMIEVPATSVICAVGERIESGLLADAGVQLDRRGRPAGCATGVANVWAAGDCRRGPATFVEAIADAQQVARTMVGATFDGMDACNVAATPAWCYERKGTLNCAAEPLSTSRCLGCARVCEVCCDVCPNRANVAIEVPGLAQHQIVHIDGLCNECGNCATFCPWEGRPYKDKLTLFWSAEDMANSENPGFLLQDDATFCVRIAAEENVYDLDVESRALPEEVRQTIRAVRDSYGYLLAR